MTPGARFLGWPRPGALAVLFLVLWGSGCAGGGCRCELEPESLEEGSDEDDSQRVRIVLPASG